MSIASCHTCNVVPPLCPTCFRTLFERWRGSARSFGWRWGAGLRITLDQGGTVARSWPEWESDEAANVRRICRRLVASLANAVPERRDAELVEAFARLCADAAKEAYATLSLDDARAFVADHDRRFPRWKEQLVRATKR